MGIVEKHSKFESQHLEQGMMLAVALNSIFIIFIMIFNFLFFFLFSNTMGIM